VAALIIEFTGVTGAGKTSLINAFEYAAAANGIVVRDAYDIIFRQYRLSHLRNIHIRSALMDVITLPYFFRNLLSTDGRKITKLAFRNIINDSDNTIVMLNLARNFMKRIGVHLILQNIQDKTTDCDFIVCDEGILHIAHNAFVHVQKEPNLNDVIEFGDLIAKTDLIIWVKSTPNKSIDAIMSQKGHSRVPKKLQDATSFVDNAYRVFETICTISSVNERLRVIETSLHDEQKIAEQAQILLKQLTPRAT